MTVRLENTTSREISHALSRERHRIGAASAGMVLTLIIVSDEINQFDSMAAATVAAQQHPCRVIQVVPRQLSGPPRIDAEIAVGTTEGPGESVTVRLFGPVAKQAASVVTPLLLPDAPVVTWWAARAPDTPHADPLGALASRRITDASQGRNQLVELKRRLDNYTPGDTDLAWTRTTRWRSLVATALDEIAEPVTSIAVTAQAKTASSHLLAGWLGVRLACPVAIHSERVTGITRVELHLEGGGEIRLDRPGTRHATLTLPGSPSRTVPLVRRELRDLITEELRVLNADPIYHAALAAGLELAPTSNPRPRGEKK